MNRYKHFLLLAIVLLAHACFAGLENKNLRCEYLSNPLGIDAVTPRLSWILTASRRGEKQTAYQILVASSPKLLGQNKGDLWDSGKVVSDETSQIVYAGSPLISRQGCYWKVRSWNSEGQSGNWSAMAQWQLGLLQSSDWSAKWITGEPANPPKQGQLVIRRATYEAVAKDSGAEVTAKVTSYVKENQINVAVDNKTLGVDPARNIEKRLRVEYELDGKAFTKEVAEHDFLILPEKNAAIPYLRKSFTLTSPVKRAVFYASALGLYEARINGQRVGNHVLAPDWTDYRKRVRYQAYDVTAMLKKGENVVGALLGNGWFSGHIGNGANAFFGTVPAFLGQLEVTCANGQVVTVATDSSWTAHPSAILSSDFMLGETYDARLELAGWDQPGLKASQWTPVTVRDESLRKMEAQVMEPVHQLCEIKPKTVTEVKSGTWVYDLGQNMVGVVRLNVSAPAGTVVTLRHAEMLNPDGSIYTRNLRGAPSVDHYTCKGAGLETWQPRFTFHGFRYVEITGLTAKPQQDAVTGIVIASDTPRTGEFSCSDPRINQLQSNIQWGQRGNYISIPTDCPQRDERLGWMGDAQVFIRTATYNSDVAAFFTKWLVDVDDGQSAEGSFGDVNPNTMGCNGVPAWGDAGVICPWTIYEVYGDKQILVQHLPAMIKWVEFMRAHSNGLIRERDRGNDYGDWLSIGANTPKDLIGTAYFAYSTHLLAKSCRALGQLEDALKYERLFEDIKLAFNERYVSADGRIKGDTQCVYAMALKFELLPENLRATAARYLQEDITAKDTHLSTGFVGVSYLLPVLTQAGKTDTAYRLLLQDTFPSWLFSVKHGATTIWERWDGWTPEKGFQDPGMNSFNHYSLGSCGEYLFGGIGGIRPASAGFKTVRIEPALGDGLTWAKTRFETIRGPVATSWKKDGKQFSMEVVVPVNTTATVYLPCSEGTTATESGKAIEKAGGVRVVSKENGRILLEVGSGIYNFASEMPL